MGKAFDTVVEISERTPSDVPSFGVTRHVSSTPGSKGPLRVSVVSA